MKGKIKNFVVELVSTAFAILIIAALMAFIACIVVALLAAIKFLLGI